MGKKEDYDNKDQLEYVSQRLSALCDEIDEPIYVSDPDTYEILFVNKKLKELFGEKNLGRKCYKVFQNLNHPCPFCTNKYIFGENLGRTHIWEFQNRRNKRWYRCIDKAIEWPLGKYVRLETAIDVTEQKKMEEELKAEKDKFKTLFNLMADPVVIVDRKGKFLEITDRVKEITGYEKEELLGKNFLKTNIVTARSKAILLKNLAKRMMGMHVVPYEVEVVTKDGEKLPYEVNAIKIQYEGKPADMVVFRDLSARKKLQEALVESEEKYRKQFEEALDAIILADAETGIIIDCNRAASELVGRARSELVGRHQRILHPPEKIEAGFSTTFKQHLKEKEGQVLETQLIAKNGEIKDVAIKANVFELKDQKLVQGTFRDITQRKKMEDERKHFQKRLSALNKHGQSLNRAMSMEEIYTLTLKTMEKTLGFEYASILIRQGKMLRLVSQRGYSNQLSLNLPLNGEKGVTVKAAKTGNPVLVPDIRKEKAYVLGKPNMLSELAVPVKVGDKVLGILNVESERLAAFNERDSELLEILASEAAIAISNLKKQKQLKRLSNKMKHLMKSTTEIMHVKDMQERLRAITKAIRKFGWRRVVISLRDENLEGKDVVTSGLTKEEIKLLIERKAPGHVWKERLGPKFEQFKIGEFYYLPWNNPWIREYVHDVPPEAPAEKATTYAGVPSTLPLEEMVDWHPQDMLYAPLRTPKGRIVGILSMDDPVDGRKPTRETLTPLELFLHQAAIVIENAQLIGSLREARKQLEAYAGQLEQKVEERTRELKKSQQKLLKAQRLAVIGELAGMVGHDLRNPLTGIAGAAYYLKKRLSSKPDKKTNEMLELIENNIVYSNKIINDLLDYSRELKLDLTVSDPKSMIRESLCLVKIPKNVQVIDLTEKKPKIRVDVGKMKRAFVNLIKNSVDAMPKGGTLTIKAEKSDGQLKFVFSDTGVGMSKRKIEKLWTPLFTTKAKGMGFGLSICKRIIEAHGGSISVKSARAKGTTFTITIPTEPKIEGGEKIWVKPLESSLLTTTKA